ncbi:hypothetical protein GBAR_LOCUS12303 [Geodia barretti]|nr:hypothetical protein GBAR_LOCUS12303 [Geodia barretti]
MDELQNRQQSHHAEDGGQLSSSTGINMSISGTPPRVLIIQAEGTRSYGAITENSPRRSQPINLHQDHGHTCKSRKSQTPRNLFCCLCGSHVTICN